MVYDQSLSYLLTPLGNGGGGAINFKWDSLHIGTGIELSNGGRTAFLREGPYMFRTIIGDTVKIVLIKHQLTSLFTSL